MPGKTRRWAVQGIAGAAGGGALGAELLNTASKMAKLKAVAAVDISFFRFKNLDTNQIKVYVYSGVGIGAGILVGLDANFTDISPYVNQPFDFDDLDGAFGRVTTAGAGYIGAVGGSFTYLSAITLSGRLFTSASTSGLNTGTDSLSIGAQAQTTMGRWWLMTGQ